MTPLKTLLKALGFKRIRPQLLSLISLLGLTGVSAMGIIYGGMQADDLSSMGERLRRDTGSLRLS